MEGWSRFRIELMKLNSGIQISTHVSLMRADIPASSHGWEGWPYSLSIFFAFVFINLQYEDLISKDSFLDVVELSCLS